MLFRSVLEPILRPVADPAGGENTLARRLAGGCSPTIPLAYPPRCPPKCSGTVRGYRRGFSPIFMDFLGRLSSRSRVVFTVDYLFTYMFFFQKSSSGEITSSIV